MLKNKENSGHIALIALVHYNSKAGPRPRATRPLPRSETIRR